jgi:hypothetical protein
LFVADAKRLAQEVFAFKNFFVRVAHAGLRADKVTGFRGFEIVRLHRKVDTNYTNYHEFLKAMHRSGVLFDS